MSMFWLNMREVSRYPSIFLPLKISLSLAVMQTAKRQAHAQKEIILKGVRTTKLFNEVKCLEISATNNPLQESFIQKCQCNSYIK